MERCENIPPLLVGTQVVKDRSCHYDVKLPFREFNIPDVALLIAEHDAPSGAEPNAAPDNLSPHAGSEALINGWTTDLIRQAYKESADPMRKVLLFLADHAGEEVTATKIAEATGAKYGWNTVAGMLGAFGRRSVNRYKRKEPMWELRQGPAGGLLRMPAAVAQVIKTVAAE